MATAVNYFCPLVKGSLLQELDRWPLPNDTVPKARQQETSNEDVVTQLTKGPLKALI
jgi:hypothetical protein